MRTNLPDNYIGPIDPSVESNFKYMYLKYRDEFVVYAFKILKCNLAIGDIVDEVFIKFNRCKKVFNSQGEAYAFLLVSVKNKCHDEKSKDKTLQRNYNQYKGYVEDHFYEIEQEYPDIDDIFKEIINIAKVVLPPNQKKVFLCRTAEGLTTEETMKKIGYSYQSVKSRLLESLNKLKEVCLSDKKIMNLYYH